MLEAQYSLEQIFQVLLYTGGTLSLFFLSMVLFKVYQILKDIRRITNSTSDITNRVHSLITGPIDMLLSIVSKFAPVIEKSVRDYLAQSTKKSKKQD
jgi:hypothetical protein